VTTDAAVEVAIVPSGADALPDRVRPMARSGRGKLRAGAAIVGLIALVGIAAPVVTRFGALEQDLTNRLSPPSWLHWFGTDELGRDVFSRCVHAIRVDLLLGIFGALLPATVGTVLGALSGYVGGWFDSLTMRVADAAQAFPFRGLSWLPSR
jgi:peptide/nickel transport system permease protein